MQLDAPSLILLARGERDSIQVLVDANERESQIGLTRVAFGIPVDQAASHPVAQQRAPAGVYDGGPQHETGDGVIRVPEPDRKAGGQSPQNPGENPEENSSLQQPRAEIG